MSKRSLLFAPPLVMVLVGIAHAFPRSVKAEDCPASMPGVDCSHTIIQEPLVMFARCGRVSVDIVEHSFNGTNKDAWIDTIRGTNTVPGALDAWNDAWVLTTGDFFYEVGSKPYDVKFHGYSSSTFRERFGVGYSGATVPPSDKLDACCGDLWNLRYAKIYINSPNSSQWEFTNCAGNSSIWNARRAAFHELGHAIYLRDVDERSGSTASIMSYANCYTWPTTMDGEAFNCTYYQYRNCSCE